MAIAWPALKSDIQSWLEDLVEKTTDDTAKFFADSYAQAIAAGADPNSNAVIPPGKEAGIEAAWKGAFAAQAASHTHLGAAGWLPVEGAIMAFWAAAPLSPAPPHPGTVVPVSNLVTMPGAPGVAAGIDKAFKQENAAGTASELVSAYEKHAGSIMGLYTGLTPPPANAPLPVPWTGIK